MSKVQELGEEFAMRMAMRFATPGMRWDFGKLLETTPMEKWKGLDVELLELYTLVLMPVALVKLTSGKTI